MMEESDFLLCLKRCKEERDAAGLVVPHNSYCPLLVAENTTRQAKYALCYAMTVVTNIAAATAVTLKRADYDKYVDLALRLLAPFVTNPLTQQMDRSGPPAIPQLEQASTRSGKRFLLQ